MAPTESCCAKSSCTQPGVLVDKQHCCTLCHDYMHGLLCGEGNGWFDGGADSYTCKLCFKEKGKSVTPITAYYDQGVAPRDDPTLLQDLVLHHTELISAKRHKNGTGTTAQDANDPTFIEFYSKYKEYLEEAIILDDRRAASTSITPSRPSARDNNKSPVDTNMCGSASAVRDNQPTSTAARKPKDPFVVEGTGKSNWHRR
jgi:hypothetical protein